VFHKNYNLSLDNASNEPNRRTDEKFQTKVLIVEDNHVLRQFIKENLEKHYQVYEGKDGQEGLELVKSIHPDVIISDVMMPKLDGVMLCQIIKNDPELNHIPFILLTAKSSVDNQLEGVSSGADYYFTKPISLRILQATIQNLMESRKKMKSLYMKNAFKKAREMAVNDKEKSFMNEFISIIEKNIERTDFDVDQLCKEIGMSRTKLYNKVKSITGKSVGELIRGLRLKRAAQILASEDTSIVQVMYRVGIQSQSYFTKSFKKEFGKTPTQFVNDLSEKSKTAV
ncbi:MAG: response regulator, partial [Bacteroidota bacterium]